MQEFYDSLMSSEYIKMVTCWKSYPHHDTTGRVDGLMWYKDFGQHVYGDFSMAVVQANAALEDQSQLESGSLSSNNSVPHGTYVGVYDGHGGPETAQFIVNNLFQNVKKFASEQNEMSENVIKKAYAATENSFLSIVRNHWLSKPALASVGSCCLVGLICNGVLYIANTGDSRAVLGRAEKGSKGSKEVSAVPVSTEHNANIESIRDELKSLHPHDPDIVVQKHRIWRVKGIIQVSKSIGDAYLKNAEFNKEPLNSKFIVPEPFFKPIISAEPSVFVHKLQREDQFLIFASDGLWEHLSNEEAVDIVRTHPKHGIARRLIRTAMCVAAKKREMRYSDLKKIDRGVRRHFHDDITVIVVFLDPSSINKKINSSVPFSIKGGDGISDHTMNT